MSLFQAHSIKLHGAIEGGIEALNGMQDLLDSQRDMHKVIEESTQIPAGRWKWPHESTG